MSVTWILERNVFASGDDAWLAAFAAAGDRALAWDDAWWDTDRWPQSPGPTTVRASLANADRCARDARWVPGAFCRTPAFACSAWYPHAAPWLVHQRHALTTVRELVADPRRATDALGASERVFVRPDSPLKPFAGRVVPLDGLTPRALDHGFYYDDLDLPIVVAPVRTITAEWRFVVVDGAVVAGSGYDAAQRCARPESAGDTAWDFAQQIAAALPPPEQVYVLDVCTADDALWLLELNPFAGADLYACDQTAVVQAVDAIARARCDGDRG